MSDGPINLQRIRRSLDALDLLVIEHPELCGDGPAWTAEAVESLVTTPTKDRMKSYRQRLADAGYRRVCFHASPKTQAALDALRADGRTIDEAISEALEATALRQGRDES